MDIINTLAYVALAAVLVILALGVFNLMKSGDEARSRSNQLMRLRVAVQFVAVVLLMFGLWLKGRAG